jgi:hypothetical protein
MGEHNDVTACRVRFGPYRASARDDALEFGRVSIAVPKSSGGADVCRSVRVVGEPSCYAFPLVRVEQTVRKRRKVEETRRIVPQGVCRPRALPQPAVRCHMRSFSSFLFRSHH